MAYSLNVQAVDVASIPLLAIERLEIVTDGSSAIYGSDAVAGVANVILKRDYDGLAVTAEVGAATEGGNWRQQYSAIGGRRWQSGGFFVAYDFGRDTPVTGRQRSYTADIVPGLTLYPYLKHHSVLASAHQQLGTSVELGIDGYYNKRWEERASASTPAGMPYEDGTLLWSSGESFLIAPTLTVAAGEKWSVRLKGALSESKVRYRSEFFMGGVAFPNPGGCYCNDAKSAEVIADGPLLGLPGGSARVAVGGGYRFNRLDLQTNPARAVRASQDTYFLFAELDLPIVAPELAIPFVSSMDVNFAVRHEKHSSGYGVTTPKAGLVYSPSSAITLKGTWGKSFKVPTLYEQFGGEYTERDSASYYGGIQYPRGSTAILFAKRNPLLRPERAETWSSSVLLHPRQIPVFRIGVTYYEIDYRNRVISPILFGFEALTNPAYTDYISLNPSQSEIDDAIVANAFFDYIGGDLSPGNVVAVINNSNVNSNAQNIKGIDLDLKYDIKMGYDSSIRLSALASHLNSKQRFSLSVPEERLSGVLYNPPRLRGRLGLSWDSRLITLSSFLNYTGGVDDPRVTPARRLNGMGTVDAIAELRAGVSSGVLEGSRVSLSVHNLFNARPTIIEGGSVRVTPYDSTNYDAIGRRIRVSLTKQF